MTATHSQPLISSIAEQISGHWWVHLLRGLAAIAIQLRKDIPDMWPQLVSGLLSIAFGLLVFTAPKIGFVAIVWPVAICAVLAGLLLVGLAFGLRGLAHHSENRRQ